MSLFPIIIKKTDCVQCGACESACASNAISLNEYPVIDPDTCQLCKACIEACPAEALVLDENSFSASAPLQPASSEDIWVLVELYQGRIVPVVYELLGAARRLAAGKKTVSALLTGYDCRSCAESLFDSGADCVYLAEHPLLDAPIEDNHADVLAALSRQYRPEIILIGATRFGRGVSARTAALLNTGLTADCTDLSLDPITGNLLQRRPAFGGNLLATIETPNHRPQMASVRPGVMAVSSAVCSGSGKLILCDLSDVEISNRIEMLAQQPLPDTTSITDASVLVAGGRGMQNEKNTHLLFELADTLGGTVAASRAAVEAGWLPYERQVGQTGKTVAPRLYIACGISGQIQHTAAIEGAKTIIAINNDPDAAIFEYADYGLVGDVEEILPALIRDASKYKK